MALIGANGGAEKRPRRPLRWPLRRVTMVCMGVENTKGRVKRRTRQRRSEEREWAERSGPVEVRRKASGYQGAEAVPPTVQVPPVAPDPDCG